MSVWGDLKTYSRFALGLPGFLGQTLTLDQARAEIQRLLAERETAFLRMVERGIYGYPRSPYLPLFKLAQCELGDIQAMVRQRGIEATLQALRDAGVYVSFEEFKGRAPLVRQGITLPVHPNDFDNPYLSHYYYSHSGGSTGAGTRVALDLGYITAMASHYLIAEHAYGVHDAPYILWQGILPDVTGVLYLLRGAALRHIPSRWFSPLTPRDINVSPVHRLATWYIVYAGRLLGAPFPAPETARLDQAEVVARAIQQALGKQGHCLIYAGVSMAVRVCLAAGSLGMDLSGATFMIAGEPPTPAKHRAIAEVGARYFSRYSSAEIGHIAMGCVTPIDENDVHFASDLLAMIQAPRQVPGTDLEVNAFCFTSLGPWTPKIALNVESDDYGVVERRSCGCVFEALGMTEHIRHIRSFRKLTGESVTLVGSEMQHVMEEVLPTRFGGSPLDYQLLEEEDASGLTRLSLLVSPRVGAIDEASVVDTLLRALAEGSVSADLASALWKQAGTLRVQRLDPIWTKRGKLNPLHLVRLKETSRS